METERRFEEAVEHLLLHDPDLASAVQRIRRAVDEEALDEAVADAVVAIAPALRKQHFAEFGEELRSGRAISEGAKALRPGGHKSRQTRVDAHWCIEAALSSIGEETPDV